MMPTVPTGAEVVGCGLVGVGRCWSEQDSMRSLPSARLIGSTDTGRSTASGWRVSGKTTVRTSGRSGNSAGTLGDDGPGIAVMTAIFSQVPDADGA